MRVKVFIFILGLALCQDYDDADNHTSEAPYKSTDTSLVPNTTTTITTPKTDTTATPTTTESTTPAAVTTNIPVTTPAPHHNFEYRVSEDGLTCIMLKGNITFKVNYTNGKVDHVAKVSIPGPESGGMSSGKCNSSDGTERIKIFWGSPNETSTALFIFNSTSNNTQWKLMDFNVTLYMSNASFPDAVYSGHFLHFKVNQLDMPEIPDDNSFRCRSKLSFSNVTAQLDDLAYKYPIIVHTSDLQIQAYNKVKNVTDFGSAVSCSQDRTSDIIPIAVGCVLAGLVLIVLIAYLVGRRRRTSAYQSV